MKAFLSIAAAVALACTATQAQNVADAPPHIEQHDVIKVAGPGDGKQNVMFERKVLLNGPDAVEFVSTESSIGKTVKGAPYSAEAVTESIQTLADGNRIVSKSSATTYRDNEGRTRREMTLSMPGVQDPPSFITINDPVSNVSFHLETKSKIARKLPVAPDGFAVAPDGFALGIASAPGTQAIRVIRATPAGAITDDIVGPPPVNAMSITQRIGTAGPIRMRAAGAAPKTESLGKRAIDGIVADGTRTTMTIPAGEIGNEREINIVTERWYSPELQTVILSKHTDPRAGETTYTLTNIKRSNPHPSLFEVPPDYAFANEDAAPGVRVIRKIERK
jgi:hypothetical protein